MTVLERPREIEFSEFKGREHGEHIGVDQSLWVPGVFVADLDVVVIVYASADANILAISTKINTIVIDRIDYFGCVSHYSAGPHS